MALTNAYEIRVWPQTHLHDLQTCVDKKSVSENDRGCYELETLMAGDVLLFEGALVHSGARGHGYAIHSYGMPTHYNGDPPSKYTHPVTYVNMDEYSQELRGTT